MNTPVKLAGFALGPAAADSAEAGHGGGAGAHADQSPVPADAATLPAGLLVSEDGYALELLADVAPPGTATPVVFRILGPDGHPVTSYEQSHEQELHLIAVRRDLAGFQHVHPALGVDGLWTTSLALSPGSWRVFADFVPESGGENRILGADLAVAGEFVPSSLPAEARTADVDGYTVTLDGGLTAGAESELTLSVSRDGRPVTDLQPYLGAYGHLVALRSGDLAYLHVHPADDGEAGPGVRFFTTAPSAGTYRLFLDFKHGSVVRTAAFTVSAAPSEEVR